MIRKYTSLKDSNLNIGTMSIITILLTIVFIVLYHTGFFNIKTTSELNSYINENSTQTLLNFFLITFGIIAWRFYIINILLKPKEVTLYLIDIKNNICKFVDSNGKPFFYSNNNYQEQKYYYVLKTHDAIHQVLDLSPESFNEIKEKESYFYTWFSPLGNFENYTLLPVLYLIFLFNLALLILTKEYMCLIFCFLSLYMIIYDFIGRYKYKKANQGIATNDTNLKNSFKILMIILKLSPTIVISIFLLYFFITIKEIDFKIIFGLTFILVLASLLYRIFKIKNDEKLINIFYKTIKVVYGIIIVAIIVMFIILFLHNK